MSQEDQTKQEEIKTAGTVRRGLANLDSRSDWLAAGDYLALPPPGNQPDSAARRSGQTQLQTPDEIELRRFAVSSICTPW